jgi:hypothetical protein
MNIRPSLRLQRPVVLSIDVDDPIVVVPVLWASVSAGRVNKFASRFADLCKDRHHQVSSEVSQGMSVLAWRDADDVVLVAYHKDSATDIQVQRPDSR